MDNLLKLQWGNNWREQMTVNIGGIIRPRTADMEEGEAVLRAVGETVGLDLEGKTTVGREETRIDVREWVVYKWTKEKLYVKQKVNWTEGYAIQG